MAPLISIIIPAYNAEQYLERCITSVLNQDYQNIEIVLVNDGSSDGSLSICQNYQNRYSENIKVISQPNTGASIARKNGIEAAQGQYLMFIDSDDFVSPVYVSALYRAMIQADAQIALCPMKRVDVGESHDFNDEYHTRIMTKEELFRRFFKYEFWGFWGGIYDKCLFDNLMFPEATVNEDYYVKAQMFTSIHQVGYVEEPLYCYEQHPGSLSRQPLSLRALGEFDNALATWQYVKATAPRYSHQSLAIASEAACKWLGAIHRSKKKCQCFIEYEKIISRFLKRNLLKVIVNPHLYWKIKLVILNNLYGLSL